MTDKTREEKEVELLDLQLKQARALQEEREEEKRKEKAGGTTFALVVFFTMLILVSFLTSPHFRY